MIYIQDRTGPGLEIWTQNLGQDRTTVFVRLPSQQLEIVCQQRDEFNLSIKSYEVQNEIRTTRVSKIRIDRKTYFS